MRLFWLIFLFPLLAFGAQPPVERNIFSTNLNADIIGTNGVGVTSNRATGRWIIDGRNLTNGLSGTNGLTTTNLFSRIYGTNGIGVSSNTANGTWLIDGSSLSNSIASVLSNKVDELNGRATNLWVNGQTNVGALLATNPILQYANPIGTVTLEASVDGFRMVQQNDGQVLFEINDESSIFLGSALTAPTFLSLGDGANAFIPLISGDQKLVTLANGVGALTNNNGFFGWFPHYITAASLDGYGFIFGATNYGATIGRGSNFVIAVETNLTMAATNKTGAGDTNFVKFNTAQPITTTASPSFAALNVAGQLNAGGILSTNGMTNGTGGIFTNASATHLGSTLNAYSGVSLAANSANTANFNLPDMSLGPTNSTGGARWLSMMPDFTRRRWSMYLTYGSGLIFYLEGNNANTGTLSYEAPTTNSWWTTLYTTSASANADSGPNSQGTATWFPGKNCDWNWLGKLGRLGTNQVRYWIGMANTTIGNMGSTDSPTTRHVAAVRASPTTNQAADVNWTFVTCDGSACTATPSIVALSTNITHLRIVEDYVNSRWLLFINGAIAATNSANMPTAALGSVSCCRTLQNVAQYIGVSSYWGADADKTAIKEFP